MCDAPPLQRHTGRPRTATLKPIEANELPPPLFVQNSRGAGKGKVHSFGKRDHAIKRNLNVPVVVRGWLYKQVSRASSAAP